MLILSMMSIKKPLLNRDASASGVKALWWVLYDRIAKMYLILENLLFIQSRGR